MAHSYLWGSGTHYAINYVRSQVEDRLDVLDVEVSLCDNISHHIHPHVKHWTHLHTGLILVIQASVDLHNRELCRKSVDAEESQEHCQVRMACKLIQVPSNAERVQQRRLRL